MIRVYRRHRTSTKLLSVFHIVTSDQSYNLNLNIVACKISKYTHSIIYTIKELCIIVYNLINIFIFYELVYNRGFKYYYDSNCFPFRNSVMKI